MASLGFCRWGKCPMPGLHVQPFGELYSHLLVDVEIFLAPNHLHKAERLFYELFGKKWEGHQRRSHDDDKITTVLRQRSVASQQMQRLAGRLSEQQAVKRIRVGRRDVVGPARMSP